MNDRATGWDWGFAAVATFCVIVALAVGGALGTWLALTGLTDSPAVATRTVLKTFVLVAIVADVLWMGCRWVRYRRARRQP